MKIVPNFDNSSDDGLLRWGFEEWDRLRERYDAFGSDRVPGRTAWVLMRYADVHAAFQDPCLFSSRYQKPFLNEESLHQWIPVETDPPEHTKYRQAMNPHFAPHRIAAMEDDIRTTCRESLEVVARRGGCEFMDDFAMRFPTSVFLNMIGLPSSDTGTFLGWEQQLMHNDAKTDPHGKLRQEAMQSIYEYLDAVIAERRSSPGDDILSDLTRSEIDGRPLNHNELREMSFMLYMAGLDTTASTLGFALLHLARNEEHRSLVRNDETMVPPFVEEVLRLYSIVSTGRVVTRDADFAGCRMKAGDRVLVATGPANRDPRQFENADRFNPYRDPNRHIAFGAGPHRCIGSHLARAELRVALEEWHRVIPEYRLAEGTDIRWRPGGIAALDRLPLVWD